MSVLINAVENGFIPNFALRIGIRNLLKKRLSEIEQNYSFHREVILNKLGETPMAIETQAANEQHYELPATFFTYALGRNLKYSCSLYERGAQTLDQAEDAMLELYCDRAQFSDGMKILELGCGWGSLTLHMARKYPQSEIIAISNSHGQREFIENKMQDEGITNVKIITKDINEFQISEKFDRVVSIEMFEHVRNYRPLFANISNWLKDDGKLFIHIFCHKDATYFFETEGDDNWMGKYFFTGGIMPSFDLFERVQDSMKLSQKWKINGQNYQRTSEDWFNKMEENSSTIMNLMKETYGEDQAKQWFNRWKIFFASCAELFGHNNGNEWFVGHYLFEKNH
ncbi:SAM-dependent methyltransferase [Halobacteriovorax marinus]|uniref:SAM-dependent methyltransferase n=1 Tax=Halobacteriovorax marinus TaxID=97084 RepID=UPI000BC34978|nr:cyclopropane-fatty-acyl-phospholipid synthase family protein [Halobacteriovorax marinus]ATH07112.1 SAM-dependent methyltransferase [Halobacteriovorax marinus]